MPINTESGASASRKGASSVKLDVLNNRKGVGDRMRNAKEAVRKLLKEIPDESSLEDIQYHIYVLEKIEKGLENIKDKKVISHAEAKKRMSKWLEK